MRLGERLPGSSWHGVRQGKGCPLLAGALPPRTHIDEIFGLGLRRRCEWSAEDGSQGYVRGVDIFKIHEGRIREKLSYVKG